jgi:general secretion pathway protein K
MLRSPGRRLHEANERRRTDGGFTFLVVVWGLSILIVLSLVFGASISTYLKTTRNAIDNARAEALADGGTQLTVLDLSAWRAHLERQPRFPRDGRPTGCSLGGGDWLRIAVEDEIGKVDLNTADERLIGAALIAAGVSDDDAPGDAQRILDYRDSDDIRRPSGAEAQDYAAAGRAGPKNQPFDAIEEVEQVLGIPAGLADALRPYATVYSGERGVDARFARERLLAALSDHGDLGTLAAGDSGVGSDASRTDFAQMTAGLSQAAARTPGVIMAAGGRAFRVLAEARTAQGAIFVRESIVEFVADRPDAFVFRRWRKASAPQDGSQAMAPSDLPPC